MPSPHPLVGEGWGFQRGGTILACQQVMHSLKKGRIQALMGIFDAKIDPVKLLDRLEGHEESIASLEREVRGLKLEYIELYDKVRHQMSRMSKRSAVDVRENNDAEVIEPVDDGVDPISARIIARRGFLRNQA